MSMKHFIRNMILIKEVVVEDNKNYDVFEKYTKVDVAFDQGYSGMRCYLNEDESFGGAYFRYTFEYETNDENLVDSSIEVYITVTVRKV